MAKINEGWLRKKRPLVVIKLGADNWMWMVRRTGDGLAGLTSVME